MENYKYYLYGVGLYFIVMQFTKTGFKSNSNYGKERTPKERYSA